jgi:hypothetical protein
MNPPAFPAQSSSVRYVADFEALRSMPLDHGVNALCWKRTLPPGFDALAALLGPGKGVVSLDAETLRGLSGGQAVREAAEFMLADLTRLDALGLDPVLNLIHAYPRDDTDAPVPTDVYSFHADSAPVPASTWLCTYAGAPTEALPEGQARRKIDDPATRATLRRAFGGPEGPDFEAFLRENCYDLHYAPTPGAQPFSFGLGNLWRIALSHPDSPVPPCIHRAPLCGTEDPPRLLLIS